MTDGIGADHMEGALFATKHIADLLRQNVDTLQHTASGPDLFSKQVQARQKMHRIAIRKLFLLPARIKAQALIVRQIARWPGRVQIHLDRGLLEAQRKILEHRRIPWLQWKEMRRPARSSGIRLASG